MSHVTHMNESCHACDESCHTHVNVTHANDACLTYVNGSYRTHANELCLANVTESSHAHANESCQTCEGVISHMSMRHATHT